MSQISVRGHPIWAPNKKNIRFFQEEGREGIKSHEILVDNNFPYLLVTHMPQYILALHMDINCFIQCCLFDFMSEVKNNSCHHI